MDWILGHTEIIASGLVYIIWEFWLGKTNLIKQNSTAEIVLEIIYKALGKLLGKIDTQPNLPVPVATSGYAQVGQVVPYTAAGTSSPVDTALTTTNTANEAMGGVN